MYIILNMDDAKRATIISRDGARDVPAWRVASATVAHAILPGDRVVRISMHTARNFIRAWQH